MNDLRDTSKFRPSALFWVLLLGALSIRLISADTRPLWWDDLHSLYLASKPALSIPFELVATPYQPLYFLVLHLFLPLQDSLLALRMPGILFDIGTVAAISSIGGIIAGRKGALYAGLLAAFNPLLVFFSHEVRFYSMATALICTATAVILASEKKKNMGGFACLAAILDALALLTSAFSALWVAGHFILLATIGRRIDTQRPTIIFGVICGPALLLAVANQMFAVQRARELGLTSPYPSPDWMTPLGWVKQSLLGPLPFHWPGAWLAVVAVLAGLLLLAVPLAKQIRSRRVGWVLALSVLPVLLLFLFALSGVRVYQHRYLHPSSALLIAVLGSAAAFARPAVGKSAVVLVLAGSFLPLSIFYSNPSVYQRFDLPEGYYKSDLYRPTDLESLLSLVSSEGQLVFDRYQPYLFWCVFSGAEERAHVLSPEQSVHELFHPFPSGAIIRSIPEEDVAPQLYLITGENNTPTGFKASGSWKGQTILERKP